MVACWAVPYSAGSEWGLGQWRGCFRLSSIYEEELHTPGFQLWHQDLAQQADNGGSGCRRCRSALGGRTGALLIHRLFAGLIAEH